MPRRNKYNAVRTPYRGHWYDSKAEAEYAELLELERRAGHIHAWEPHPERVNIIPGVYHTWRLDFLVENNKGQTWYVDVKGRKTDRFIINMKLWKQRKPKPLPLIIVKRYREMRFHIIDSVGMEGINMEQEKHDWDVFDKIKPDDQGRDQRDYESGECDRPEYLGGPLK